MNCAGVEIDLGLNPNAKEGFGSGIILGLLLADMLGLIVTVISRFGFNKTFKTLGGEVLSMRHGTVGGAAAFCFIGGGVIGCWFEHTTTMIGVQLVLLAINTLAMVVRARKSGTVIVSNE
ncbi:TPA: hypothetical protein DF272_06935 [Candidatus Falkowbacteria bacterium]|nr:hypothetical protein [Candidatus Falkowbacteria bacterium]